MWTEQFLMKIKQMRLIGMVSAIAKQSTKTDMNELSFEERLSLLIDAGWNSRENR